MSNKFNRRVYMEFDGDDEFASFCDIDDVSGKPDGHRIAVYTLTEVREVAVSRKLKKVRNV